MSTTAKLARPTAEPASPKLAAPKSAKPVSAKGPQPLPFFARLPGLASPVVLQAKLTVNRPGDAYEQEADRVADRVLRMPAPQLQRKCSCGGTCDECVHGGAPEQLQLKPLTASGHSSHEAPSAVGDVLRSPGRPLDSATRAFFEPRFGHNFGNVRVHTDSAAAKSATAINALAYTAGSNIVFAEGQYNPHSSAGGRLLAHELVHTVQQGGGASASQSPSRIQRTPGDGGDIMDPVAEPAGGCGLCFGKVGPRDAGNAVHKVIQALMIPSGIKKEFTWGKGRVDLVLVDDTRKRLEIGEIKPGNEQGIDAGIAQLETRLRTLPKLKKWKGYDVAPLRRPVSQPISFDTQAPTCSDQPISCYYQQLIVQPVHGLYLYHCNKSYSQLLAQGCHCECKEPKEKKPEKEKKQNKDPGTTPSTLPEKLLELGKLLAPVLGADLLLGAALEVAGPLIALALSPFVAIAALVLGVVYFWDKLMWLGDKIAGIAKWVFGKIAWVVQQIASLAIKLGEAAVWLAGKIEWLVEKLVDGIKFVAGKVVWVAHKAVAGAKWIGRGIASGARSLWHWIFGSDVEATVPVLDLPVTERPTHCATVAHEDAIINISSDLLFAPDEWKLKPEADIPLAAASARILSMLNHKDDRVMINGYTDNTAGVEYNQALSERRAQAVADWFVQHNILPQSIIRIYGHGKTEARSNDPAGRAKDRRVEIWATKHGSTETSCW